jgi:hypothetical protein
MSRRGPGGLQGGFKSGLLLGRPKKQGNESRVRCTGRTTRMTLRVEPRARALAGLPRFNSGAPAAAVTVIPSVPDRTCDSEAGRLSVRPGGTFDHPVAQS